MFIVDTDVLSIIHEGWGPAYQNLSRRLKDVGDTELAVTIITFEEQTRGWLSYISRSKTPDQSIRAYAKLHQLIRDYAELQVLPFDQQAAIEFARLRKSLRRI